MEEPCQIDENEGDGADDAKQFDGRREEGVAVGERRVHGACARPETAAEPSAFDDAFLQFVVVEGCFNVGMDNLPPPDSFQNIVNKDYEPIPGLYAVGLDAAGLYGDSYNMEVLGAANGFTHTSGRIAARHIIENLKA